MFDTSLYYVVLGLTATWQVADERLDGESTGLYIYLDRLEGYH